MKSGLKQTSILSLLLMAQFTLLQPALLAAEVDDSRENENDISLAGVLKSFNQAYFKRSDSAQFLSENNYRFLFKKNWDESSSLHIHYALFAIAHGKGLAFQQSTQWTKSRYRLVDLNPRIAPKSDSTNATLLLNQNLDRLFYQNAFDSMTLTLGRQPISLGTSTLISPNDFLQTFNYTSIDRDYRPGIDAVRAEINLGEESLLDMAAIAGKDFERTESAAYLHFQSPLFEEYLHLYVANFRRANLIGASFVASLLGVGVSLEGAQVWPGKQGTDNSQSPYFRSTIGLTAIPHSDLTVAIEVHTNEAGTDSPSEYGSLFSKFAYTDGGLFLLGRSYFSASISWSAHPLLSIGISDTINRGDESQLVSTSIEYNPFEDIVLSLSFLNGFGQSSSEFNTDRSRLTLGLKAYF